MRQEFSRWRCCFAALHLEGIHHVEWALKGESQQLGHDCVLAPKVRDGHALHLTLLMALKGEKNYCHAG